MSSWQEASPVAPRHASHGPGPPSALSDSEGTATVLHPNYSALPQHGWMQLLRKLTTFLRRLWLSKVFLFIAVIIALPLTPGIFSSILWYFQYSQLIYAISFSWSSPKAVLLALPPDRLGIIPGTCQWQADVMSGPLSKQLFFERNLWPV